MNVSKYLKSIFDIVEYMIKKELPSTGKNLITYYIEGSHEDSMQGKARDAITRYTQMEIPTLDEIRQKSDVSQLSQLDHLILKMEYEARNVSDIR
jgi:hypothetical protein